MNAVTDVSEPVKTQQHTRRKPAAAGGHQPRKEEPQDKEAEQPELQDKEAETERKDASEVLLGGKIGVELGNCFMRMVLKILIYFE